MNKLDQLKQYTTVVADTGDIAAIAQYQPQDATTNPSLLLKAAQMPQYHPLVEQALRWGSQQASTDANRMDQTIEKLMVNFGVEILKVVPGRVSAEVDACLSFDTESTVAAALRMMALFQEAGVGADRVLIKIAATWEGIAAAKILEQQGIHCNMTLIFSLEQAVLCADVGATLVSPFVGRIYDWYKQRQAQDYTPAEDPGVLSVRSIYDYYKIHGYNTIVMGASFRSIGQIEALAGCDYLTISPALMQTLQEASGTLSRQLSPESARTEETLSLDERGFRWHLNQNAMATEKLAEGIRLFAEDLKRLRAWLASLQAAHSL